MPKGRDVLCIEAEVYLIKLFLASSFSPHCLLLNSLFIIELTVFQALLLPQLPELCQ